MFKSRFVVVFCALIVVSYLTFNYKSLRLVFHPDRYHGHSISNGVFFEGWYYKLVFEELKSTIIVIPGVHRSDNDRFTFTMIAYDNTSNFFRLPFEAFSSSTDEFLVTINDDKNIFSYEKLIVNLQPSSTDDATESFQMNLTLSSHHTIPDLSWLMPGTMGPFSWMPTMQCNHHVLSLQYEVQGSITINQNKSMPVHGVGYLEKDWGYSFPSVWIWGQGNQWEHLPSTISPPSLFFSLALIPWYFNLELPGFLVIFEYNDEVYRFNSYLLSLIDDLTVDETTNHISFAVYDISFQHKLHISTYCENCKNTPSVLLYGPRDDRMDKFVREILVRNIYFNVRLTRLIQNLTTDQNNEDLLIQHGYSEEMIFQGRAKNVAVEINGDIPSLIKTYRTIFENFHPWNYSFGRSLIQYYKLVLASILGIIVIRFVLVKCR
ncbi:hypothetical protein I4U23_013788 [Adineta vaga]|nr:hypothetical protein I4U23_013788 [Adineta vaga]